MKRFLWGTPLLVLMAGSAQAASINSIDRGWYNVAGSHTPSNTYYMAGQNGQPDTTRNFFVFDLTAVSGPVTTATLHLWNPSNPFNGYVSPHASETYEVFDVTTSIATLTGGTGGTAAYADLGSGSLLGSFVATSASNGTFVDIPLNAAGLAYVNSNLGGQIAFGGWLSTLDGTNTTIEYLFAYTYTNQMSDTQLLLNTVPVPAAIWLISGALGGLGIVRRRQAAT